MFNEKEYKYLNRVLFDRLKYLSKVDTQAAGIELLELRQLIIKIGKLKAEEPKDPQ